MNFLLPFLSHTAEYDPEAYNIGLLDGLAVALGGYAVVFAGLIALMVVVIIMGKVFSRKKLGDLAKCDEDVLSYIAFPNLAEKYLEERKAKEENVVTYSIVEC